MGSKPDLRELNKFVYWRSSYNISVLNIRSKNNFCQVMKFVYWCSTCNLSVLYMGSKYDLAN